MDIGVEARWEFPGELFEWRGPSPYHFIEVPEDVAADLHALSPVVTYGWGVIPVTVRIGEREWTTSLFPKDGGYLVPIKDVIRHGEGLVLGDAVLVEMAIR
jgi:hypothetical protein